MSRLNLQNFRSYSKAAFDFFPQTTLITGPNACGKTNLIEAIYLLATGKSFRAERENEVIQWGKELSIVSCQLRDKDGEKSLEVRASPGEVVGRKTPRKNYLVNGIARRMIDFVGNLRAVLFWPEDLELVTGSPSLRRKYLDSVLVQVDREYRRNLFSYERGLRQRNRLLDFINEGKASRSQLGFWNQLLIRSGGYLTDKREEFIHFVNSYQLSAVNYQLEYAKSIISESRLEQYKNEEIAAKATLVGPHRDDFIFQFSKENQRLELSKYGSRGEQRLAVLWLKLAELDFMEERSRETGSGSSRPILLLDDIFSELDEEHRSLVWDLTHRQQTIIASADPHVIPKLSRKEVTTIALP